MNFYEILGVTPESSLAEIKAAYRKLARKYHPDVNPSGAKRFKQISLAYETLTDEKKRKNYDTINGIFKKETTNPAEKNKKFDDYSEQLKKNKTKKKSMDFSKIFNFENANANKKHSPINGEDINTDISISIKEAVKGTNRTVNVVHSELCPCCRGRKFINGAKCSICDGTGEYSQHKKITVKIPPNVKNNSKLRIKGEGTQGQFGGKNGDLYLHITIEQSAKIKYDNLNILYTVPITPFEAVLGSEIDIPVFDGHVKLKLPQMTSNGQKFRLASQGLKRNGKIGDMIVTVSIEIPSSLSDDEIKLYEKLKKLSASNIRENLLNE